MQSEHPRYRQNQRCPAAASKLIVKTGSLVLMEPPSLHRGPAIDIAQPFDGERAWRNG